MESASTDVVLKYEYSGKYLPMCCGSCTPSGRDSPRLRPYNGIMDLTTPVISREQKGS